MRLRSRNDSLELHASPQNTSATAVTCSAREHVQQWLNFQGRNSEPVVQFSSPDITRDLSLAGHCPNRHRLLM